MSAILRRRDLDFILLDVLGTLGLTARPAFADQSPLDWSQFLDLAERVAADRFAPFAKLADEVEPRLEDGGVVLPLEAAAALGAYRDAGFQLAGFPREAGGLGLPAAVVQAAQAIFTAANVGWAAYPLLSVAAANLLHAHGDARQRETWLAPLLEGRFFGTMCLSEPQAGSSLADIRTRAEPQADGSFRLVGAKMWISGGDQPISENIVHLVLAKIPGGPPGVKGISLFLVPKILPDGTRNDIAVTGLNHKMGYRGTSNCALAFGERGGATGWIVGRPGEGLAIMFHMMNEARIGVGTGAAALANRGYLEALAYAKERRQGRPLAGRDPASPMIPIIGHPDVRRMLLAAKALSEGALALCLAAASLVDDLRTGADPGQARRLLDILTPIVKSWPSEHAIRANDLAIQVLGGCGYTRDFPVERLWRDNRLNPIHEGTTGIQALDLLGRKAVQEDGACLTALLAEIGATVAEATGTALADHAAVLTAAAARAADVTETLAPRGSGRGADEAGLAHAGAYLDMMGHIVVGWMWLRMALVADRQLAAGAEGERRAFLLGKRAACDWFFRHELPRTRLWADALTERDRSFLDMAPERF